MQKRIIAVCVLEVVLGEPGVDELAEEVLHRHLGVPVDSLELAHQLLQLLLLEDVAVVEAGHPAEEVLDAALARARAQRWREQEAEEKNHYGDSMGIQSEGGSLCGAMEQIKIDNIDL